MRVPREMIPLEPVDEVRLTIVTDNVVDVTLGSNGVINIVRHAQVLTGVTAIHAVVGGFHLNGPVLRRVVQRTTDLNDGRRMAVGEYQAVDLALRHPACHHGRRDARDHALRKDRRHNV